MMKKPSARPLSELKRELEKFQKQGASVGATRETKKYVVPFGIYRGRKLSEIPREKLVSYHNFMMRLPRKGALIKDFIVITKDYLLTTM